jgi:hypothetical protein
MITCMRGALRARTQVHDALHVQEGLPVQAQRARVAGGATEAAAVGLHGGGLLQPMGDAAAAEHDARPQLDAVRAVAAAGVR